jgi:hypothetical protein
MAETFADELALTAEERDSMHARYRQGGREREMAPHMVYTEASCPHDDCDQPMQAIDFRLEDHGRTVDDPLVGAWWNDLGFAGRCPRCRGWTDFTIRGKSAITAEQATTYPQLPDDWYARATIL